MVVFPAFGVFTGDLPVKTPNKNSFFSFFEMFTNLGNIPKNENIGKNGWDCVLNRQVMVELHPLGGMTERLKVTVLKTVVVKATVGSNPTPSADGYPSSEYGEVPEWLIGLAC